MAPRINRMEMERALRRFQWKRRLILRQADLRNSELVGRHLSLGLKKTVSRKQIKPNPEKLSFLANRFLLRKLVQSMRLPEETAGQLLDAGQQRDWMEPLRSTAAEAKPIPSFRLRRILLQAGREVPIVEQFRAEHPDDCGTKKLDLAELKKRISEALGQKWPNRVPWADWQDALLQLSNLNTDFERAVVGGKKNQQLLERTIEKMEREYEGPDWPRRRYGSIKKRNRHQ